MMKALEDWTWPKTVALALVLVVVLAIVRPETFDPLRELAVAVLTGLRGLVPTTGGAG